jgi:argininosuccinate lyase
MPFREAHGVLAGLVRTALGQGKTLSELTAEELTAASPLLAGDGFYELLRDGAWLESKVSEGGTSLGRVREQLARARAAIAPSG